LPVVVIDPSQNLTGIDRNVAYADLQDKSHGWQIRAMTP